MKRLVLPTLAALVALLLLTTGAALASPAAQRVIFDNLWAQRLIVTGATELRGPVTLYPQTAISVTDGMTVTPRGAFQPLMSAGDVTVTVLLGCNAAGRQVTLVNVTTPTITFPATGALKLSADAALGQFDSLSLLCGGADWIETARADN